MATWTHGTAGRVTAADFVHDADFQEICAAVNRRRLLVYLGRQDFSGDFQADTWIEPDPIGTACVNDLRTNIDSTILLPAVGGLGGVPASPSDMDWLWPLADSDENKVIVKTSPGPQKVSFFEKMNSGSNWTDSALADTTWIKDVHLNELRWSIETLVRGRWKMPIYFSAGILSILPDDPWIGEGIANNGTDELRSLGFALIYTDDSPPRGLQDVTVRSSSRIYLTADADCQVDVYRCRRQLDYISNPPTWNEYDPDGGLAWQIAGCGGADDRQYIDSLSLTADVEGSITGSNVAAALQAMIDGAEQNIMLRRADTGPLTVGVTGRIMIEFDIDVPPN